MGEPVHGGSAEVGHLLFGVAMTAGQKLAVWVAAILFSIFVWPTPYRMDGRAKISRLAWALDLDRGDTLNDTVTLGLLGFGLGAVVGYGAARAFRRTKDRSSMDSKELSSAAAQLGTESARAASHPPRDASVVKRASILLHAHKGAALGIGLVVIGIALAVLGNRLAGDPPINWMSYLSFGGILLAAIFLAKLVAAAWQAVVKYLTER